MSQAFWIVIACGVLALVYGLFAYSQVMAAGTGNDRMRAIAAAIQVIIANGFNILFFLVSVLCI